MTDNIVTIIAALTTALVTLIPLYFREKRKLREAEAQRDVAHDSIEDAGPGPISAMIKSKIKATSMARGIPIVEERPNGKED